MLKPRSFTFFASRNDLVLSGTSVFSEMIEQAAAMSSAYAEPRTLRLTLPAISLDRSEDFDMDLAMASRWYERGQAAGFRWINQPFHLSGNGNAEPEKIQILSDILAKHQGMFSSINVTSVDAIPIASRIYSRVCKSLSRRDFRGFANFRLGIGFNITDYTPFFPFSDGGETGVSVALESLPIVRDAWVRSRDLGEVSRVLLSELEKAQAGFERALKGTRFAYKGADWSLAPLPNGDESVVQLIEVISGNPIGSGGNVNIISKLTQCLKAPVLHDIKPTGFNGVMLSVLEDDVLASRFRHRDVTVNDLLLYSTTCGCGLDMVPIGGDTPEISIAEYASDTGALAFRLHKPLGVRFLPIAALKAGQETEFSHDFVCNSAVASL